MVASVLFACPRAPLAGWQLRLAAQHPVGIALPVTSLGKVRMQGFPWMPMAFAPSLLQSKQSDLNHLKLAAIRVSKISLSRIWLWFTKHFDNHTCYLTLDVIVLKMFMVRTQIINPEVSSKPDIPQFENLVSLWEECGWFESNFLTDYSQLFLHP